MAAPSYDELHTRTQQPIERLRLERNVSVNVETENLRPVVRGEIVEMPAPVIARTQAVEPRGTSRKQSRRRLSIMAGKQLRSSGGRESPR